MAESKTDERIREIEVTLAAHLATCSEASKNAATASKALRDDINGLSNKVESLREDRNKVRGGVLAFRVVAAILVAASLIGNIYWAWNK